MHKFWNKITFQSFRRSCYVFISYEHYYVHYCVVWLGRIIQAKDAVIFLKATNKCEKNHLSLKIRNAITGLRKSLNIQKAYCHCAFIFVSLTCEEYPHIILSYLLLTFYIYFFPRRKYLGSYGSGGGEFCCSHRVHLPKVQRQCQLSKG